MNVAIEQCGNKLIAVVMVEDDELTTHNAEVLWKSIVATQKYYARPSDVYVLLDVRFDSGILLTVERYVWHFTTGEMSSKNISVPVMISRRFSRE